jgi:adenosylcobinamide-phosphate synthase
VKAALALVLAYGLDRAFGEPPDALHPVAWMGTLIARGKAWALRGTRLGQLGRGSVLAIVLPSFFAASAYAILRPARGLPGLELALSVLLLKPMFAVRSLGAAAFVVRDALDRRDVPEARRALGSLCSRNAGELGEAELVAATIESVAENTSDSVVAPLFFFVCAGVPGAVFYRVVNTLDAMVGYHGRLEYAGKASARLDDLLNLVPARITAVLLLVAGALAGRRVGRGARMAWRDAKRTESPNAGWPMATMAGLLGVQLTKANCYTLGDPDEPLAATQITAAWRTASLASTLALALAVGALEWIHG